MMQVGRVLYELSRRRLLVGISVGIATIAAVFSAYRITLAPPGLHPRAIGMSTASTQLLIDNPDTIVLDLSQGGYQLQQMAQSATLLGNVLGSLAVRTDIARIVGVPVRTIETTEPATPQFPQAFASPRSRTTTDILSSNNQYRINIQVNPTVPILDIYTEAHSVVTAKALANAAVTGLRDYLSTVAPSLPSKKQVQIEQLGLAQGGAVTGGLRVEVLGLVFLFALILTGGAIHTYLRVLKGWRLAKDVPPPRTPEPPAGARSPLDDLTSRAGEALARRLASRPRAG
jgi:hypothetical protein